jgi:hypothetical protein
MVWKVPFWVAHHLFGIVSLVGFAIFIGARNRRPAKDFGDGRVEFALSRGVLGAWIVVIVFLGYQSIEFFVHSQGNLLNIAPAAFPALLALLFLFGFPGTLVISSDGLQQVRWCWRNKRIQWKDIVEINTGKKNPTVTITGRDGTKIAHLRQFPDRFRFLLELKEHCGENLPSDFPREPIGPPIPG